MPALDASSFSPLRNHAWEDRISFARAAWSRTADADETSAGPATDWQDRFAAASERWADNSRQEEVSGLQQRAATLQQAADLLARISELQALAADPAADEEARATYETEFAERQAQLRALGDESGESLFAGSALAAEEGLGASSAATGEDDAFESFRDDFTTAEAWQSTVGEFSVSDGTFFPIATGYGAVRTQREFSGPLEIKFDLFLPGAGDSLELSVGGATLARLADGENLAKWEQRSVRIVYDGAGSAATFLDGSDVAADVQSGLGELAGALELVNYGLGSAQLRNFEINRPADEALAGVQAAAAVTDADEVVPADAVEEPVEAALTALTEADELVEVDPEILEAAMEEIRAQEAETRDALDALTDETPAVADETAPAGEAETFDDAASVEEAVDAARQEILLESATAFVAQANLDERNVWALLA